MSWNHENVLWQSKDKTWNLGLFVVITGSNYDDPDYDEEWDVDYDETSFEWVTTGHATERAAKAAWDGANIGISGGIPYSKENVKLIAEYDRMALWLEKPELAEAAAKKEAAKAKREHVKKLKELFTENDDYRGRRVTITMKLDTASFTIMGASQSYTGYVITEGDWLVVEKQKVKNLKTGRLNQKLHAIKSTPADYWGNTRGRGYY